LKTSFFLPFDKLKDPNFGGMGPKRQQKEKDGPFFKKNAYQLFFFLIEFNPNAAKKETGFFPFLLKQLPTPGFPLGWPGDPEARFHHHRYMSFKTNNPPIGNEKIGSKPNLTKEYWTFRNH